LLTYPVLMAADIIIHNANKVPVGKDQEQNLEMARKFARRFNNMYGNEYFNMPEPFNFGKELIKVPGLDGTGKMGKTEGNGILLAEEPSVIRKKVMSAVTDSGPTRRNQKMPEPIRNLFFLLELLSTPDTHSHFLEHYKNCTIRYGDLKKQLAEDIIKYLSPFREKILEISNNDAYLSKVARLGAEKARASASKTLKDVREIIGFKPFY
jgi:tryptophanyl-tRNA synthetase